MKLREATLPEAPATCWAHQGFWAGSLQSLLRKIESLSFMSGTGSFCCSSSGLSPGWANWVLVG